VPGCSPLAGRSIRELEIRQRTGASIVGVLRQGQFIPNPHADFCIGADDLVAVIGNAAQREAFQLQTLCSLEAGASAHAGSTAWSP
jgi:CPA2 family monovalent cation:H+ antiporter-2